MEETTGAKKDYKGTFYNLFALGVLVNLVSYALKPMDGTLSIVIFLLQLVVVFLWCRAFNAAWKEMGKKNGWMIGLIVLIPYGVVLCLIIAESSLRKAGYWKGSGSFRLSK
jgi:Ca2+/Na+ antiporter